MSPISATKIAAMVLPTAVDGLDRTVTPVVPEAICALSRSNMVTSLSKASTRLTEGLDPERVRPVEGHGPKALPGPGQNHLSASGGSTPCFAKKTACTWALKPLRNATNFARYAEDRIMPSFS